MIPEDVSRAFELICKNYGMIAGLNLTEPLQDRMQHTLQVLFVDMHVGAMFGVDDKEIISNVLQTGIKSKKDYRRLRSLVRFRLLDNLHQIQEFAEDGIRRLGGKV